MKRVLYVFLPLSALIIIFTISGMFRNAAAYKPESTMALKAAGRTASRGGTIKRNSNEDMMISSNEAAAIKVMTYNIHRGIDKGGKLNLENTSEVISQSQADIVAIQEVERNSFRTKFKDQVKILSEALSMNYAFGKSINIFTGQYGNAILSRYPIVKYEVIDLPSRMERRTLLKTVINVNGKLITVYNTHLGLDVDEREKQFEAISKELANTENDFIIMGDFNSIVDKPHRLSANLVDSADALQDEKPGNTFEEDNCKARIDYIFTSDNLKSKGYNIIDTDASDHYPVLSDIELP